MLSIVGDLRVLGCVLAYLDETDVISLNSTSQSVAERLSAYLWTIRHVVIRVQRLRCYGDGSKPGNDVLVPGVGTGLNSLAYVDPGQDLALWKSETVSNGTCLVKTEENDVPTKHRVKAAVIRSVSKHTIAYFNRFSFGVFDTALETPLFETRVSLTETLPTRFRWAVAGVSECHHGCSVVALRSNIQQCVQLVCVRWLPVPYAISTVTLPLCAVSDVMWDGGVCLVTITSDANSKANSRTQHVLHWVLPDVTKVGVVKQRVSEIECKSASQSISPSKRTPTLTVSKLLSSLPDDRRVSLIFHSHSVGTGASSSKPWESGQPAMSATWLQTPVPLAEFTQQRLFGNVFCTGDKEGWIRCYNVTECKSRLLYQRRIFNTSGAVLAADPHTGTFLYAGSSATMYPVDITSATGSEQVLLGHSSQVADVTIRNHQIISTSRTELLLWRDVARTDTEPSMYQLLWSYKYGQATPESTPVCLIPVPSSCTMDRGVVIKIGSVVIAVQPEYRHSTGHSNARAQLLSCGEVGSLTAESSTDHQTKSVVPTGDRTAAKSSLFTSFTRMLTSPKAKLVKWGVGAVRRSSSVTGSITTTNSRSEYSYITNSDGTMITGLLEDNVAKHGPASVDLSFLKSVVTQSSTVLPDMESWGCDSVLEQSLSSKKRRHTSVIQLSSATTSCVEQGVDSDDVDENPCERFDAGCDDVPLPTTIPVQPTPSYADEIVCTPKPIRTTGSTPLKSFGSGGKENVHANNSNSVGKSTSAIVMKAFGSPQQPMMEGEGVTISGATEPNMQSPFKRRKT